MNFTCICLVSDARISQMPDVSKTLAACKTNWFCLFVTGPKAILSPAPWIQTVNFEATLFSQCKLVLNFQRSKQIKRKLDYKIIQIVWEAQTTAVRKTSWFWNISFCVKKRNMNIQVTDYER